ncbi:MAG: hypothetical protein Q4D13_09040 [Erysipelotrichaceae bacterium]|nr:hypothetical protein [Erysipelotrichaceae bacterium]
MINAKQLRNKENLHQICDNKPGLYKWWAEYSEAKYIAEKLGFDFDELKSYVEYKENKYCIYVGIAVGESLRKRINIHINRKSTKSSTLRKSISSIVAGNHTDAEKTDYFIDKLYVEYCHKDYPVGSKEASENLHTKERCILQNHLCLLNIQNNNHPEAEPVKKSLRALRKRSK